VNLNLESSKFQYTNYSLAVSHVKSSWNIVVPYEQRQQQQSSKFPHSLLAVILEPGAAPGESTASSLSKNSSSSPSRSLQANRHIFEEQEVAIMNPE
jgi:hypothetical protein